MKISTSLYSVISKDQSNKFSYNSSPVDQIDSVIKIATNALIYILSQDGVNKPAVRLSVDVDALLIPNWGDDVVLNYTSSGYINLINDFVNKLNARIAISMPIIHSILAVNDLDLGQVNIQAKNFYPSFSENVRAYMDNLKARGSIADLIKNTAIINNVEKQHLQVDSNTIMKNPMGLYDCILGANHGIDALNASLYDPVGTYVSPHNKIVYTAIDSEFAKKLKIAQENYCLQNRNNDADKVATKNSIYSKVFMPVTADQDVGFTKQVQVQYPNQNGTTPRYAADLGATDAIPADSPYRITKHIVTSVNASWAAQSSQSSPASKIALELLNQYKLGTKVYQDIIKFDFGAFSNALAKYNCDLIDVGGENQTAAFKASADKAFVNSAIDQYARKVANQHPSIWPDISHILVDTPTIPDRDLAGGELLPGLAGPPIVPAATEVEIFFNFLRNTV